MVIIKTPLTCPNIVNNSSKELINKYHASLRSAAYYYTYYIAKHSPSIPQYEGALIYKCELSNEDALSEPIKLFRSSPYKTQPIS